MSFLNGLTVINTAITGINIIPNGTILNILFIKSPYQSFTTVYQRLSVCENIKMAVIHRVDNSFASLFDRLSSS